MCLSKSIAAIDVEHVGICIEVPACVYCFYDKAWIFEEIQLLTALNADVVCRFKQGNLWIVEAVMERVVTVSGCKIVTAVHTEDLYIVRVEPVFSRRVLHGHGQGEGYLLV